MLQKISKYCSKVLNISRAVYSRTYRSQIINRIIYQYAKDLTKEIDKEILITIFTVYVAKKVISVRTVDYSRRFVPSSCELKFELNLN